MKKIVSLSVSFAYNNLVRTQHGSKWVSLEFNPKQLSNYTKLGYIYQTHSTRILSIEIDFAISIISSKIITKTPPIGLRIPAWIPPPLLSLW